MTTKPAFLPGLPCVLLTACLLAACGGGGNDSPPGPKYLSSESSPVKPTLASSQFNIGFLPLCTVGANWNFDVLSGGVKTGSSRTSVSACDGMTTTLVSTSGSLSQTLTMQLDQYGVYASPAVPASVPGADVLNQPMRLYAFPSYAQGEPRVVSRQLDQDLDGDGAADTVSVSYQQVYMGVDRLQLGESTYAAAHFANTTTISVTLSSKGTRGLVLKDDVWLANGLGYLKLTSSQTDLQGNVLQPLRTWQLTSLQVGDISLTVP